MSDINANIVVSPIDLNVVVSTNLLSFTPDAINMSIYAGGLSAVASGLNANIANVHIYGGTNGYVLQTDGVGNLTWTAQTGGGGGNGSPGGSNSQVQFNNAGSFGGNSGFTFNSTTGNLNVPNNIIATTLIGNVANANYSNYSGTATSANTIAGANVTGTVANATYAITAGTAYSVAGANVTGTVANATYAITAGTAYSVAGANVTGQVAYANIANNVAGSNVSGQVANALVSGTVYTAAQANITSVGNLTSLNLIGTGSVQQIQEKITSNATAATGNINYDLLTQAILYNTANATADFTLNFRGNSSTTLNSIMSSNQSMTCTFINPNGATPYYPTVIKVDGNTITTKWQGNLSLFPIALAGSTSIYNFNIIKTAANSFVIYAAGSGYT